MHPEARAPRPQLSHYAATQRSAGRSDTTVTAGEAAGHGFGQPPQGRNVTRTLFLLTVPRIRNSLPCDSESPVIPLAIPILTQTMAQTWRSPFHGG